MDSRDPFSEISIFNPRPIKILVIDEFLKKRKRKLDKKSFESPKKNTSRILTIRESLTKSSKKKEPANNRRCES